MLKEIVAILRKTQDPDYIMQENTTDFIMNIVANLIADDIEGINGQTINKRKRKNLLEQNRLKLNLC